MPLTEAQIAAGDPAIAEVQKAITDAFEPFFTGDLHGDKIDPTDPIIQARCVVLATIGAIQAINKSRG